MQVVDPWFVITTVKVIAPVASLVSAVAVRLAVSHAAAPSGDVEIGVALGRAASVA